MKTAVELVAIGGSAGSLEAIIRILGGLVPGNAPAILIVLHRKAGDGSMLTELLASKSTLAVKEAEEKETINRGIVYLAPADYHLLVEKDHTFSLDFSEKLNFSRPSIDVTFQSAGEAYGNSLLCLLLSGANSDGTMGMKLAQENGAKLAVQNPETADSPYMPQHAMDHLVIDYVVDKEQLPGFLNGTFFI